MLDKNSPFSAISTPKRSESRLHLAVAVLADAMLTCELAPGALVTEVELDARYALGLASVRGALARLQAQGRIEPEGRRGWRVLPISGEHLADLLASRDCLEPVLGRDLPPSDLAGALAQQSHLAQATLHHHGGAARLHQERKLLQTAALAVAAPRLRGWLFDSWELSLRADLHLTQAFGIERRALPLAELLAALSTADHAAAQTVLQAMRADFSDRCRRALSRSPAPLAPPTSERGPNTPKTKARTTGASDRDPTSDIQHGDPT